MYFSLNFRWPMMMNTETGGSTRAESAAAVSSAFKALPASTSASLAAARLPPISTCLNASPSAGGHMGARPAAAAEPLLHGLHRGSALYSALGHHHHQHQHQHQNQIQHPHHHLHHQQQHQQQHHHHQHLALSSDLQCPDTKRLGGQLGASHAAASLPQPHPAFAMSLPPHPSFSHGLVDSATAAAAAAATAAAAAAAAASAPLHPLSVGSKALAWSHYLQDPLAKATLFDLGRLGHHHYPMIGKKLFGCPQCRYMTDRKNNLKRHVATMHQECDKALECCGVVFKNKASLRDHVLIFHANGYMCRYCGRNFCRKALLKRHLTVHSGQKDYLCAQCDYATSHKSNLERHKKVHERQTSDGGDMAAADSTDMLPELDEQEEEEEINLNRHHHHHHQVIHLPSAGRPVTNTTTTAAEAAAMMLFGTETTTTTTTAATQHHHVHHCRRGRESSFSSSSGRRAASSSIFHHVHAMAAHSPKSPDSSHDAGFSSSPARRPAVTRYTPTSCPDFNRNLARVSADTSDNDDEDELSDIDVDFVDDSSEIPDSTNIVDVAEIDLAH